MSSETLAAAAPGWFGKLPAVGDFIRHELPDDFVTPWDDWLRKGMAAGAGRAGEDWQDLFLRFPVWHFLRRGSTAGMPCIWAGVLVPSADRVGRLFPFTVAFSVSEPTLLNDGPEPIEKRLDLVASSVLTLLGDDDLDAFQREMAALEPLLARSGIGEECASPSTLALQLGRRALLERLEHVSVFWTGGDQTAPLVMANEPVDADAFCQLVLPSSIPLAAE